MKRFEAFLAMARSMHRDLPYRMGQAYFNALVEFDPTLASEMAGEYPDPFYQDGNVPEFLIRVYRAWKEAA